MKPAKRKTRAPARKGQLLNVWIAPAQKRTLQQLARKTKVNQSVLVRHALDILFERAGGGQLQLGFPSGTQSLSTGTQLVVRDLGHGE